MKRTFLFRVAPLAILLILSGLPLCTAARRILPGSPLVEKAVTPRGPLLPSETSTIALFRNASPSVVYITSLARERDAFSFNVQDIPQGTGSGFIWDDKGHIVTNFHVIMNADAAEVTLADNSVWQARLVGSAPDQDLAVLQIQAPADKLRPLPLGHSGDLEVGQSVYAIGNPFGLDHTLTTGVISALGREIQSLTRRPISGVIQTDAAINPGNSGGPLLDSSGRLIGVNTQIYSLSGAFAGIGFAVPADIAARIVPQLIAYGKVTRPGLGISIADDNLLRRIGISGVLLISIAARGSANRAGLRGTRRDPYGRLILGDIIVAVDGSQVKDSNDLFKLLDGHAVGDHIRLKVLRGKDTLEVPVRLQELN